MEIEKFIIENREKNTVKKFTDIGFNIDISTAYKISKSICSSTNEKIKAWKMGGTTSLTRKIFNVDNVYMGPLFESEVFFSNSNSKLPDFVPLRGEVELALRISKPNSTRMVSDGTCVNYSFDAWALAVEFPFSIFSDVNSSGIGSLLADRCSAGALVIGPIHIGCPPKEFSVSISEDSTQLSKGDHNSLLMSPAEAATQSLKIAHDNLFEISSGQWVSTGGVTECVAISREKIISVSLNNIVEFSLKPA